MERFERKRLAAVQIFLLECLEDLRARKLLAAFISKIFDNLAQLDMHRLGQLVAKLGFHHIGHTTLTRLRVNANNRLIRTANILWINGQIGNLPQRTGGCVLRRHALIDRILV